MSKSYELDELFNTITTIYLKNMNFLSHNFKELHLRIQEFEQSKVQNHFIEFIDNHFELIDSNKIQTYNCNPFFDAQKRCDNFNYHNLFSLSK